MPIPAANSVEARLRAEATSVKHMLTRVPQNRFCADCQVAKRHAAPALRSPVGIDRGVLPSAFGDLILADHLIISDKGAYDLDGNLCGPGPARCCFRLGRHDALDL